MDFNACDLVLFGVSTALWLALAADFGGFHLFDKISAYWSVRGILADKDFLSYLEEAWPLGFFGKAFKQSFLKNLGSFIARR